MFIIHVFTLDEELGRSHVVFRRVIWKFQEGSMRYVGLTDDPLRRRLALGNPPDWIQFRFTDEEEARAWERKVLSGPGITGGLEDEGWRYGYTFSITTPRDS